MGTKNRLNHTFCHEFVHLTTPVPSIAAEAIERLSLPHSVAHWSAQANSSRSSTLALDFKRSCMALRCTLGLELLQGTSATSSHSCRRLPVSSEPCKRTPCDAKRVHHSLHRNGKKQRSRVPSFVREPCCGWRLVDTNRHNPRRR